MVWEVEIKARVARPRELEELLDRRCKFIRDFRKQDVYYKAADAVDVNGYPRQARLRNDNGKVVLTAKEKSLDSAVEVNREIELIVNSAEQAKAFLRYCGFTELAGKEKSGKLYTDGNLNLELCHLAGLGWFLEIEKLVTGSREPSQKVLACREVKEALFSFGVKSDQIEPRYYIDMLIEQAN